MHEWLGLPAAASAHAGDVDRIIVLVHWLMLVLFVGWATFFVYVLVQFRHSAHPVANRAGLRGHWSTWVEGGVLAAEITLLVFFAIPTWSARVDAIPSQQQRVVVRVVAEQFSWNVHYPGRDEAFGRTALQLVQPVWFTPTRTDQWEIACSQLCGLGHYRMRGFYTIDAQTDYDAWLTQETAALTTP